MCAGRDGQEKKLESMTDRHDRMPCLREYIHICARQKEECREEKEMKAGGKGVKREDRERPKEEGGKTQEKSCKRKKNTGQKDRVEKKKVCSAEAAYIEKEKKTVHIREVYIYTEYISRCREIQPTQPKRDSSSQVPLP